MKSEGGPVTITEERARRDLRRYAQLVKYAESLGLKGLDADFAVTDLVARQALRGSGGAPPQRSHLRHAVIDAVRSELRRKRRERLCSAGEIETSALDPDPDVRRAQKVARSALKDALRSWRAAVGFNIVHAVAMTHIVGLSQATVARALGLSQPTISRELCRSHESLRGQLVRRGLDADTILACRGATRLLRGWLGRIARHDHHA